LAADIIRRVLGSRTELLFHDVFSEGKNWFVRSDLLLSYYVCLSLTPDDSHKSRGRTGGFSLGLEDISSISSQPLKHRYQQHPSILIFFFFSKRSWAVGTSSL